MGLQHAWGVGVGAGASKQLRMQNKSSPKKKIEKKLLKENRGIKQAFENHFPSSPKVRAAMFEGFFDLTQGK